MATPLENFDLLSLTENASATFSSSSDPCLDFFFQIVPDTPPSTVVSLLDSSWQQDPLTTLKLVFQLRGVRGSGKSDKEAFYAAALWMHKNHPKTLLANLHLIPRFGYFKDLLELLQREVQGEEETAKKLEEKQVRKEAKKAAESKAKSKKRYRRGREKPGYFARKGLAARIAKEAGTLAEREIRIAASLEKNKLESEKASILRQAKVEDLASRAKKKYSEDSNCLALYLAVAQVFAQQLILDKDALDRQDFRNISLAGKWTPSLDSSYDLSLLMCEEFARKIFPKEKYSEYDGLEDQHYAYRTRDRLRKEIMVPLRQALKIPEVYMSAQKWAELPYSRVPSVAMKNYTEIFNKHDGERFSQYLIDVASGKKTVAAGALLPHIILKNALSPKEVLVKVAELQWQRMVNDLKESGSQLKNCLAVCDVSGSMSGTPMEVCIALGLLVAEMSEEPWKNHICTFSESPELHVVEGNTLRERYKFTSHMNWGMNTNFQKVFDNILAIAEASKLPPEKMISRLFVFSDMEFDQASQNPWETDYMVITRKFSEAGYGEPPQIVFWNLRDSRSTPVLTNQKGVALVSGFSKNLLKMFLEDEEIDQKKLEKEALDPMEIMRKAITGELFDELKVVD